MERQCASGLMTIATAAKSIMCNEIDIAVAGGVESISLTQNKHKNTFSFTIRCRESTGPRRVYPHAGNRRSGRPRYNISREAQDEYSYHSQMRTAAAQKWHFDNEIVHMKPRCRCSNKETKETTFKETVVDRDDCKPRRHHAGGFSKN